MNLPYIHCVPPANSFWEGARSCEQYTGCYAMHLKNKRPTKKQILQHKDSDANAKPKNAIVRCPYVSCHASHIKSRQQMLIELRYDAMLSLTASLRCSTALGVPQLRQHRATTAAAYMRPSLKRGPSLLTVVTRYSQLENLDKNKTQSRWQAEHENRMRAPARAE